MNLTPIETGIIHTALLAAECATFLIQKGKELFPDNSIKQELYKEEVKQAYMDCLVSMQKYQLIQDFVVNPAKIQFGINWYETQNGVIKVCKN